MHEHFFQCPFCWKDISMLLDASVDHQKFIEDCEVCCHPIELDVSFEKGELVNFSATSIGQ